MSDQPSDARPPLTRAELRAARETPPARDDIADATPASPVVTWTPTPTAVEVDTADEPDAVTHTPHVRRTDWRLGGRTVQHWREMLLAGALISVGAAILFAALLVWLWPSPWAPASATAILWIGMLVPVVAAFLRSRPIGLLRLRPLDLLYGVVLGAMLRVTQGWLELAAGGSGALPSYVLIDGAPPTGWWLTDILGAAIIAPVLEEFFFRGVVLVTIYTMLRRPIGRAVAGAVALLVSSGLFLLAHGLTLTVAFGETLSLALLGLVCGLLVLLTGRIWGAVLVHVVYNVSYIVLALIGTYWS